MMSKAGHDWMIWIAVIAMVVSLGLHVGRVVRFLSQQDTAPVILRDRADVMEPRIDMDSVLALMPFGRPIDAPTSPTILAPDPSLTLHGVVRADPVSRSRAILSVGKEPARSFVVGDEVAGGWRLVEVRSDHVWLEAGDQKEILSLTDDRPLSLARSDSVSRTAGATGDLDAMRQLIFDQVNNRDDIAPVPSSGDGLN